VPVVRQGAAEMTEPWLDRHKLADHLSVSERTIDYWRDDGLPEWVLGGRAKFRLSEVEPWLVEHGHLRQVRPTNTVVDVNGAAALTRSAPDHRR
jgi:hypothetical protein